mmetsp:Transcript_159844/g.298050  ORF Transcript_159844/g.298050 Transcript_159844/m.298050 type:complete len:980 (+) Transcript_159844:152-3091(+)
MECFAGIASSLGSHAAAAAAGAATGGAATAGLGKAAFDYNRENFMNDREMRQNLHFKVMKMRVTQSELWREDVRDLVSLTEYKMHIYLLTNVLILGFAIILWTEGKMGNGTPHWLMVGNIISIAGAFMFLLLSIWLAMHAAVTAQSYEVRLRTQMVRLPIPSWQEIESCRTYGSQFEQTEARQAFRVPFLMGKQEKLVKGLCASPEATSDAPRGDESATLGEANGERPSAFADPWGLERGGEDIKGLGCSLASQVADLRHVKLSRQAAAQWQTYDAFARISMSIGAQHLMFAMLYYVLGYMLVEVGCKIAATYGAVMFTVMAETIVKLDMSLSSLELRLAQILLAIGPFFSTVAAHLWWDYATWSAEFLIPIAFLAHGAYLTLVAALCRVRVQGNGALLPVAFRSVLYLDVFGWLQGSREDPNGAPSSRDFENGSSGAPALQSFSYENGMPSPTRPQDFKPANSTADQSGLNGAPDINRPGLATEIRTESFYQASSFVPSSSPEKERAPLETGHEKERPGVLPWSVFCGAILFLCSAWTLAAMYSVHGAATGWSLDLPESKDPRAIDFVEPLKPEADFDNKPVWWPWVIGDPIPVDEDGKASMPADGGIRNEHFQAAATLLQESHKRYKLVSASWERINTSWPYPDIVPSRLACDASGTHFIVSDRLMMLKAKLDISSQILAETASDRSVSLGVSTGKERGSAFLGASEATAMLQKSKALTRKEVSVRPSASFEELECPAIFGQGLEDAAIVCNASSPQEASSCEALVLHRQGRRLAACGLGPLAMIQTEEDESNEAVNVSGSWLEQSQKRGCNHQVQGGLEHAGSKSTHMEKPRSLTVNPQCAALPGKRGWDCAVLGTTHGRVVQLDWRSQGTELIPTELFSEGRKGSGHASVRAVGSRYLGVLQPDGHSIQLLDVKNGGLNSGKLSLPSKQHASAFCVGGGYVYTLSRPKNSAVSPTESQELPAELWRIPLPPALQG